MCKERVDQLIPDRLIRWGASYLVPAWAEEMDQEGIFQMRRDMENAVVKEDDYILVENGDADVTVFVFSGLDGLFGGGPRFEFRSMFQRLKCAYNLVFVREVRGFSYHLSPYGTPDGLAFYEERLTEIRNRLGARHNVALGFSAGGAAAVYFGTRCGMQKVIAFSPAFPTAVYTAWRAQLCHYLNVWKLLSDPKAYTELTAITNWGMLLEHRLKRVLENKAPWDVAGTYRSSEERPALTLVYGSRCRQDTLQAMALADVPGARLLPLDTGFHNVPGFLKGRGELGPLVVSEIEMLLADGPTIASIPLLAQAGAI